VEVYFLSNQNASVFITFEMECDEYIDGLIKVLGLYNVCELLRQTVSQQVIVRPSVKCKYALGTH